MATARSEIPVVKGNGVRDINGAIDAIRQQLRVIADQAEQANLKAGQNAFAASGSANTLAQLQQQIAALQQLISQLSSNTIDAGTVMAFSARHG